MFLPLRDSPNPVGFTPWVNYALLAANVAVFVLITLPLSTQAADPTDPALAEYVREVLKQSPSALAGQLSAYDVFVFEHGFKPGAPEITDLFSSLFLHGGLMHLLGNMLFLWIYGDNCEHRLGRLAYLGVYLATGVVATLAFAMFAGDSMLPLVGASGAISGVLGLYFVFFPRNMVKVFIGLFPFIFDTFWVRARWVLGFYVVVDNILPFVAGAASNVAYGAHLGGFFAGLAVAWFVEGSGDAPKQVGSEARPRVRSRADPGERGDPASGRLRARVEAGDLDGAVERAARMDAATIAAAVEPQDLYALARGLAESGRDDLAARALRKRLGVTRQADEQAVLHLALGELRLAQGQPAAAYQHLMTVIELVPRSSPEAERAVAALNVLTERGTLHDRS